MFMAVALAATAAFAQDKPAAAPAPQQPAAPATTATATPAPDADPVIISAGTVAIRRSDFEAAVKTLPAEYQSYALGAGKKQFAEDFLRMKLLAAEGMKEGLDKSPQVQKQLDLMKENLVATEELHKIENGIAVTEADLKKAYEDVKKENEQVKASHILIAPKDSPAAPKDKNKKQLTDAEAKAKAEDLRKKIVAGTLKFEDVAKKESDDVESGKQGGDLGAFGKGQMVKSFEDAAFAAKTGEVTPVVKSEFGYHIIKVQEHSYRSFDELKPTLDRNIRQKKLRDALDAIKDSAKPTFNEAYFTPAPAAAPAKAEEPKKQ
jgi:parvulin-like peptidyl-prolyl isomerase